ncbi:MAG TPA: MarR family transcriptional regulator [Streptosporangiaceae bacterium]
MDEKDRMIDAIEGHERVFMRLMARENAAGLFSLNLTMRQIKVLMVLDIEQSLSMHELAKKLGVGLATTTGIVDRLTAQNLAERREDPDDRRIRRIELSDHGHEVIDQMRYSGRERKRRVLRRLTPELLADFARVMAALGTAVEAELDAAEAEGGEGGDGGGAAAPAETGSAE